MQTQSPIEQLKYHLILIEQKEEEEEEEEQQQFTAYTACIAGNRCCKVLHKC